MNRTCQESISPAKVPALERQQRGQGLTEYLVVLLGLLIVWTTVEAVVFLINTHNENYSEALKLIY